MPQGSRATSVALTYAKSCHLLGETPTLTSRSTSE
jgi:hypothetical protein